MPKGTFGWLIALLCAGVLLQPPAWSQGNTFATACEGTQCSGGGVSGYQYTIMNNGSAATTVSLFYVGTMDLVAADYTAWVAPPGFTWTVAPWAALPGSLSVMYTTQTFTPHGAMPIQMAVAAPGAVVWWGNATVNPGQTLTFGFNNTYAPWDMEWFCEHPGGANVTGATLAMPIAGPLGVFTQGFAHGPSLEPTAIESKSFGRVKTLYR